jgi:hypothetical protein
MNNLIIKKKKNVFFNKLIYLIEIIKQIFSEMM